MSKPSLPYLGIFALVVTLLAAVEILGAHFLLPLENRVSDFFVRTHAAMQQADPEIVIVDIDEKSLAIMAKEAGSWPWPRAVHGELVEAIEKQSPKAIVFDIQFADRDIYRPESDAYFNEAVKPFRNIYFPMIRLEPEADDKGLLIKDYAALLGIMPGPGAKPDARVALSVSAALDPANWRLGVINYQEDSSDGIGRRYPVYLNAHGWRIPSLPARVAKDLGYTVPDTENIILGWRGGESSHPHVSYADLYLDANRSKPLRKPDEFSGKIVIIGATAPGLHDIRSTPISSRHQAVEILATAIDNLKNRGAFRSAPLPFQPVLALFLLLTLLIAFSRFSRHTLGIGVALAMFTLLLTGVEYMATGLRWLIPVLVPVLFAWVYYFAAALHEYLLERKKRQQAILTFNRFLDPRVVDQLVGQGKTAQSMNGQAQNLTVLFSDIRNFTTYSEQHSAAQVVEMLNEYFSMQVEAIFQHGGTLDKFIGDAIMAFWGAPTEDPEQARHAIEAALDMAIRLEAFKLTLGEAGAAFEIGIGIHSGPAVVGFIGSSQRQDYTAIGDTVNLSSRIEGLTKGVSRILVSEDTMTQCKDMFDFIDHGFYKVKGRAQEVRLFEPRKRIQQGC
ncbi:MAG: CHASE2 domain-containing protein [Sulfuricellaceae bacterium]|nr:CHASE2 domain-containing protein [Sulfuricellaceae bacterium]